MASAAGVDILIELGADPELELGTATEAAGTATGVAGIAEGGPSCTGLSSPMLGRAALCSKFTGGLRVFTLQGVLFNALYKSTLKLSSLMRRLTLLVVQMVSPSNTSHSSLSSVLPNTIEFKNREFNLPLTNGSRAITCSNNMVNCCRKLHPFNR
jgi:hypothetical protein